MDRASKIRKQTASSSNSCRIDHLNAESFLTNREIIYNELLELGTRAWHNGNGGHDGRARERRK